MHPIGAVASRVWYPIGATGESMAKEQTFWQGMLALMVLKTLRRWGPCMATASRPHRGRPAATCLAVNYGTLYPALTQAGQEGYICSEWGTSDNNRKAKYYKLTRAGRKQLEKEARDWEQTTEILARFLAPGKESA